MKINFSKQVLPHIISIAVLYIITLIVFSPAIFDDKSINQHDINQWEGSSKELRDYRESSGEEGLWANSMFSGMPAYLVNVEWNDKMLTYTKIIGSLGLPHPVRNHFMAFVAFYVLLLCFKVNPYLAIPGAIAFGLSSYMIVGTIAGHNARIGSIAFTPLVIGGFHLIFNNKKWWVGLAVMSLGMALHLRENHPQITYYLVLSLLIYGIILLIRAFKNKELPALTKNIALVAIAGLLGLGTYSGKLWSTLEYSKYSIRGASDLSTGGNSQSSSDGLSKAYAFEFSNGIMEPMTLMIPDFYGGSSSNYLVSDRESNTYRALASSQNPQQAQQLAPMTSSYWGNQRLAVPYYAGALMIFLCVLGIAFAKRDLVIWLVVSGLFGIVLSWGDSFSSFNYFMFDYFPAYNKFRSVTFALLFPLISIPLLGSLGLQRLSELTVNKEIKKKFLYVLISTAGLCLLIFLLAGLASFTRAGEGQLPPWFLGALQEDRKGLLRADTLRSLAFILSGAVACYLFLMKKVKAPVFAIIIAFLAFIDLYVVDSRYLTDANYSRPIDRSFNAMTNADQVILQDASDYRVYNIQGNAFTEARTSYYHNSIGGYHGAKIRRYQEVYDQGIFPETQELVAGLQGGVPDFESVGILNMMNIKYLVYGPEANQVITNPGANGSAWFVNEVVSVGSADEEIQSTGEVDTKNQAVIDNSRFDVSGSFTKGTISLTQKYPNRITYQSSNSGEGLAVFSEIYYPEGWKATIDGQEAEIVRANYVLRALKIPAGDHTIEFVFSPSSYRIGNTLMLISNLLMVLVIGFAFYRSIKK